MAQKAYFLLPVPVKGGVGIAWSVICNPDESLHIFGVQS